MDIPEQIRQIKTSLRGMMNGMASHSMRDKGLAYRMNFGVELPRLKALAAELPHTRELALALWSENIRECRLMAGMLMPPAECDADLGTLWVEQMHFAEEAEYTVMHLFSHTSWASAKAFEWMASEREMFQLCAYLILSRLFMQGATLSERDEAEYLDQAAAALKGEHLSVARAAQKSLLKYMDLGQKQERAAEAVLSRL